MGRQQKTQARTTGGTRGSGHSTQRSLLAAGEDALTRHAWDEARAAYEAALLEEESAEAFEGLSWAAWWRNDAETVFRTRETAFQAYRRTGREQDAARMAMWLAADYGDFRGELAVASGWRQRARRLLKQLPMCEEHGWSLLLEGDAALSFAGDTSEAKRCASEAVSVGRALKRPEFGILALALHGLASVEEGDIDAGMKMLDEAAVAALAGEVTQPLWVSWTLCYLLFACERARDYDRATEWCHKAREYADRFDIARGQAVCRVHYAALLMWRGEWSKAEQQLSEAAALLEESPWVAEALVRLGELRRRQGNLDEAAALFARIEWHPMALFGLAELALDTGRPRDALEMTERALRQIPETSRSQRATACELLTRSASLLGHHGRARQALATMEQMSDVIASPPLRAAARYSAGILAIQSHDYDGAMACLEDALDLFKKGGAPYEVSRTRLELASVLVTLGRLERARAEATTAREVLEQLGSPLYARKAAALLQDIDRRAAGIGAGARRSSELTQRQAEILQLIARGSSDREIASTLGLSEHTVHRHVANILRRLDTPTRAAAAARAASHGLI